MPILEFRCTKCKTEFDELVRVGTETHDCPSCGNLARQVILTAAKLDTIGIAQKGGGPEFQKKLDRMYRSKRAKQEKAMKDHGDYGSGLNTTTSD